jgi:hypothetical protein
MKPPRNDQPPPPDTEWQESLLPGERSGEGSKDLFKHMQRDMRRKAGLPGRKKPDDKTP